MRRSSLPGQFRAWEIMLPVHMGYFSIPRLRDMIPNLFKGFPLIKKAVNHRGLLHLHPTKKAVGS
jgi:hypothetical protein